MTDSEVQKINSLPLEQFIKWLEKSDKLTVIDYLSSCNSFTSHHFIHAESALRNKENKHHWSITPGFGVALLAMVFSAIAAWPVASQWFSQSSRFQKPVLSQAASLQNKGTNIPGVAIAPQNQANSAPLKTPNKQGKQK